MKIIILHGDDTAASYERLTRFIDEAKKRRWEIIYDDLAVTPSLFGSPRLAVVRDLKVFKPKSIKALDKIPGTLVVYNEGVLAASYLKIFVNNAKVERFDIPKIIWKFLDKPSVKLLHEVVKKEPIELVFHLFAKRLRRTKYIDKLARIDMDAKTGKADLLLSLDLFIAKNLQLHRN